MSGDQHVDDFTNNTPAALSFGNVMSCLFHVIVRVGDGDRKADPIEDGNV
jgi:hypothetical protein